MDNFAFTHTTSNLRSHLGQSELEHPDGLFLLMQPIMSLAEPYESLNFEVLLRMREPDGHIAAPECILRSAEESGAITAIDMWVLKTTLEWISRNEAQLTTTQFICVNLNGASLNAERFVEHVVDLLTDYSAVLGYLCLEITESVALHDLEKTQSFIGDVQQLGAKIALYDFGAGHACFRYLKHLSADALKIDGEFIRSMRDKPKDFAIVEALVSLARALGMRSIAEWVEDADTLNMLRELGADYVQGFAVAHPLDPDSILSATSSADFVTSPSVLRAIAAIT